MSALDKIISEFVGEYEPLLAEMESGLLLLEQADADADVVNTLFRAVHSIKGGAGFIGLAKIEKLAHKMEDLLNLIRGGDLEPIQPVTDSLLQALDVLAALFRRVDEHEAIDIEGAVRALEAALSAGVSQQVRCRYEAKESPAEASGLPAFAVSDYLLQAKLLQGNLYYIHLNLSLVEMRGMSPIQVVNEMLAMGELIDSIVDLEPSVDPDKPGEYDACCHVLFATSLDADMLAPALKLEPNALRTVTKEDFEEAPVVINVIEDEAGVEDDEPWEELFGAPEPGPTPPPQEEPEPAPQPRPAPEPTAEPAPKVPRPISAVTRKEIVLEPKPSAAPLAKQAEPEPEAEDTTLEFLIISLGNEIYGVDILSVREIIGIPSLTRLPRSPEHILGVMNLRGRVVPVVDLRKRFNMSMAAPDPVIVVVMSGSKTIGAVVDQVLDVAVIERKSIQAPPGFSGKIKRDYINGLVRHNDELVIMLELDKLLAPEVMGDAA